MAYLISKNSKYLIYLKAFHQFGRLVSAVDTLINNPKISRIHAIIEWIDKAWYIRDISKNGVWLNNTRIETNKLYPLNLADNFCFSDNKNISFIIDNLDQPKDLHTPYINPDQSSEEISTPIILEHYDIDKKTGFCESVDSATVSKISNDELLNSPNTIWQLIKGADYAETETIATRTKNKQKLTFIFNISQDEELTELTLQNNSSNISCDTRSHHYLTALLARYRSQDCHKSLPEHLQGWRTIEQLTRDIGLSESHVNIQIHRARKQLSDKLKILGLFSPLLIERKKGQVRFAATDYKIFKGQTLEEDSMCLQPFEVY